jgi:hypothetical protein
MTAHRLKAACGPFVLERDGAPEEEAIESLIDLLSAQKNERPDSD